MAELPAWWHPRKTQNRRSKQQETTRAKQLGGRRQAGSGSSWRAPNDVKTGEHLEELKRTDKSAYRLRLVDWNSLKRNARACGREPRLVIDFDSEGVRLIVTEEVL